MGFAASAKFIKCTETWTSEGYFQERTTRGFFQEGTTRGFFQNFSKGRPKVVKFVFSHSKERKQLFCWNVQNPGGTRPPAPPFRHPRTDMLYVRPNSSYWVLIKPPKVSKYWFWNDNKTYQRAENTLVNFFSDVAVFQLSLLV